MAPTPKNHISKMVVYLLVARAELINCNINFVQLIHQGEASPLNNLHKQAKLDGFIR